jgi:hypothetical protein
MPARKDHKKHQQAEPIPSLAQLKMFDEGKESLLAAAAIVDHIFQMTSDRIDASMAGAYKNQWTSMQMVVKL